jgi:peptidoglycan/LPS O-acetylase OafA/YrhL
VSTSASLRIESLDILRALAVFLVIGHHTAFRFVPATNDPIGQILEECGWIGVDLFFVISGFLIAKVLLRDPGDIRGFFRRRAMRILPLLLVAVALYAGLSAASGVDTDALRHVWSPALLMNGWTIPLIGYSAIPYTITWSLSVEEAAYVSLGVASYLFRNGMRWLLLAFVAGALATRALIVEFELMPTRLAYYFVPARIDTIALGGLAALGMFKAIEGSRAAAILSGAAMLLLIAALAHFPREDPLMARYGYTIFGFVVAALVACLAARSGRAAVRKGVAWPQRLLILFGRYSYFIYLFHMFVLEALLLGQRVLPRSLAFWEALLIASGITFGMSALSWRYFEHPLIVRSRLPILPRFGASGSIAAQARPLGSEHSAGGAAAGRSGS